MAGRPAFDGESAPSARAAEEAAQAAKRRLRLRRTAAFCTAWVLTLVTLVLVLLGLAAWTALIIAAILACPVVMLWAYVRSYRPLPFPIGDVARTHGMTLNWMAPFYDWLCRTMGMGPAFRLKTLSLADLKSGDAVLDAGCGTGVLTRLAGQAVAPTGHAVGIDPAPDMIRLALENSASVRPYVAFSPSAIEDLPFEDASFDAAFASVMIHHLPQDLKRTGLREVFRVLKPGGRFVVVDLDRPARWYLWLLVWPLLLMPNTAPHLRGEVPRYLREAGFEGVEARGRWLGVLTFWLARKPADAGSDANS
jgi:ubiquinone/menaquinone biosynthesis C-methylase UbiE